MGFLVTIRRKGTEGSKVEKWNRSFESALVLILWRYFGFQKPRKNLRALSAHVLNVRRAGQAHLTLRNAAFNDGIWAWRIVGRLGRRIGVLLNCMIVYQCPCKMLSKLVQGFTSTNGADATLWFVNRFGYDVLFSRHGLGVGVPRLDLRII